MVRAFSMAAETQRWSFFKTHLCWGKKQEKDIVAGVVVVQSKGELPHQGVTLTMEGSVNLQLSAKSVGVFEAFYNSLKPIQLLHYQLEVSKPGKFPNGKTEIPFEVPLKPKPNKTLYETYHGVFVNIQYQIKVDMKRSLLNKDLSKQCEFIVEYKDQEEIAKPKPIQFSITPETLTNIKEKEKVPKFKARGKLDSSTLCITKPLTGEIVIESCETGIKSIEIQLVRVETCGCAEGFAKDGAFMKVERNRLVTYRQKYQQQKISRNEKLKSV